MNNTPSSVPDDQPRIEGQNNESPVLTTHAEGLPPAIKETVKQVSTDTKEKITPPRESFDIESMKTILNGCADVHEVLPRPEQLEEEGLQMFEMDITDTEKFRTREMLTAMVPYFGELVWDVFQDRDHPKKFRPNNKKFVQKFVKDTFEPGDMENCTKICFVASPKKVEGFTFGNSVDVENVGKAFNLLLIKVAPGQALGEVLLQQLLSDPEYKAISCVTHTPALIKRINKTLEKNRDWDFSFAGALKGNMDAPMTEAQRTIIQRIGKVEDDHVIEYEMEEFQKNIAPINPHLVSYGPESGIPPRKLEELNSLSASNPRRKTFENLIQTQQEVCPNETVYGKVALWRKELIPENA